MFIVTNRKKVTFSVCWWTHEECLSSLGVDLSVAFTIDPSWTHKCNNFTIPLFQLGRNGNTTDRERQRERLSRGVVLMMFPRVLVG